MTILVDYKEIVKDETRLINQALAEFLDWQIEEASKYGDVHTNSYSTVKEYMMRGGKRLRPLLVVIGYKSIKESVDEKYLYRVACSVELLHNGSLLHDDLIDHDETRRGGPTIHAFYREWFKEHFSTRNADFGMTMAILSGDALLNMGAEAIDESNLDPAIAIKCHKLFQASFHDLVNGVLLEISMVKDPNSTPEMYLDMVRMKTAVLFEKSLLMGAEIAGATDSQLKSLSEFGVKIGQAFQIQDDILGSFGDESVTGKPSDGDIREGKKTMLVIEAIQRSNPKQKALLVSLLGKDKMSAEEVMQVKSIFRDTGSLKASQTKMELLLKSSQNALEQATPQLTNKYKKFLLEISNFLVGRSY